jgi:diguanylate cyclase (GGDEF)-like protein
VSSDLSEDTVDVLRSRTFDRSEDPQPDLTLPGLSATRVDLRNSAHDLLGLMFLFQRSGSAALPPLVMSQMAQLGSLAIENATLYERLAFQAQHDVLTGLPNRLLFQDRVQQAILLAQRNRRKVGVLWIDVDRFKQINDTLGHRAGDELLAEVARRLRTSLRESDTAARIGGDEFVVLASEVDSGGDAVTVAEKIMKALRAPAFIAGHELTISASVGIGVFPEHGADPAALMRNADLAMYQAKRAGRDAIQTFQPQFGASVGRRLQVEQALRHAMDANEFYLEYQPLIDRFDNLDGFEALLRWKSAKLGSVSPAEFIPIAEDAGLIGRIGEWVTRMACRDGAVWLHSGINVPRIAVNASGLQFADRSFAEMVNSALQEFGFPADRLEIEVTETALVNNIDRALEQIEKLRALGIKFAIDDFGTGYSSLNQLRTLPVDYVKVDRSFIKDLHQGQSDSSTLVRGIIGLAHNLQLHVVAEGVETEAQLSLLRSMGCDVSQGFFLHRPMSVEAAEKLMKQYAEELVGVQ